MNFLKDLGVGLVGFALIWLAYQAVVAMVFLAVDYPKTGGSIVVLALAWAFGSWIREPS